MAQLAETTMPELAETMPETEPTLSITLTPEFNAYPENGIALMCATIKCAEAVTECRPVDIVLVLDLSGSMDGEKLGKLIATIYRLLDVLQAMFAGKYRVSITTFSTDVHTVYPMGPPDIEAVKALVAQFKAEGETNLSGGLFRAAEQLSTLPDEGRSRSVWLLTDGHPSTGVRDVESLITILTPMLKDTPVNTFGFGFDHDSNFLSKLANATKGMYTYVPRPDGLTDAIATCLGTTMSHVVQNTSITVRGRVINVDMNPADVTAVEDGVCIYVPDMSAGATFSFLFEFQSPQGITATAKYINLQTGAVETVAATCDLPVGPSDGVRNPLLVVPIARRLTKAAMRDALAAATIGEFPRACVIIDTALVLVHDLETMEPDAITMFVVDLETAKMGFRDRGAFHYGGRHFAIQADNVHTMQRGSTQQEADEDDEEEGYDKGVCRSIADDLDDEGMYESVEMCAAPPPPTLGRATSSYATAHVTAVREAMLGRK
jgi:uncharacterized protein YegL